MEHKIYSILYIGILFFFNDTATTEIYTLSLHDALPIWVVGNCLLAVLDLSPARHRIDGVARLRHIFVCATPGKDRCGAKGGDELLEAFRAEVERRGLSPAAALRNACTRRHHERSEERRVGQECRSRWSQ